MGFQFHQDITHVKWNVLLHSYPFSAAWTNLDKNNEFKTKVNVDFILSGRGTFVAAHPVLQLYWEALDCFYVYH